MHCIAKESGRYVLSVVQAVAAIVVLSVNRRHILVALAAPFRRPSASRAEEPQLARR